MKTQWQKTVLLCGVLLCVIMTIIGITYFGEKKQVNIWYVEQGLENTWARILREADPPESFAQIQTWDGAEIPSKAGILIATKPWQTEEKITAFPRLSLELEHNGATPLALDPWMVFRKHMNPPLTYSRLSQADASGLLLIPGAKDYDLQTALFRLMGSEPVWLYAPLSVIRHYRDPRKSLLEATPLPESGSQHSLQAKILWALPTGTAKNRERLKHTIKWLKDPKTQTIIADNLEWIPADPYGEPFDPVSLSSHRAWLTAEFVYTTD
jgi:hypothetical protein